MICCYATGLAILSLPVVTPQSLAADGNPGRSRNDGRSRGRMPTEVRLATSLPLSASDVTVRL
jgi:hypothetical protein